ncbi:hypothetical protein KW786_02920 [Candidatus Parcubacteria bacterium]|nr:hypothetical protein [Candidatus Parcubacteria bacterium]
MVTTSQEPELKEFLKKEDVRTMHKDIKRLKEDDSLEERKKIKNIGNAPIPAAKEPKSNAISEDKADQWVKQELKKPLQSALTQKPAAPAPKPVEQTPKPAAPVAQKPQIPPMPAPQKQTPPVLKAPQTLPVQKPIQNIVKPQPPQPKPQDLPKPVQKAPVENTPKVAASLNDAKQFDNELEKQQIFLLESQKKDIEKQIRELSSDGKSESLSKKAKLTAEKSDWEKKLAALATENQKDSLGREDDIEKETWSIEKNISELDERIKLLDEEETHLGQRKSTLQMESAKIDKELEMIYTTIKKRQQNPPKPEAIKEPAAQSPIEPKKTVPQNPFESKQAFANSSPKAVEKLAASTKIEQAARAKFMEDVEKWASSTKDKK